MTRFVFFLATFLLTVSCVFGQATKSDLEKQRAAIQKEIDDVKASLNETKKNKKETLGQLSLIQKRLRLRQSEIDNINQQMALIQGDINTSYHDINKLKKELDTLKMQYEKSVLYAYKNRSNYDFLNFIFSSSNFNDALKRVAYLRSYRNYREEQATNIKNTQVLLEQKITGLNENKVKKTVVLVEENKQRQVLEVEKKEKDAVVSKLKSREKELIAEMAAKSKQDQKLGLAITAAIRRAREAAVKEAATAAKKKQAEDLANANKIKPAASPKTNTSAAAEPDVKREAKENKTMSVFDADPESKALSVDFEKNRGSLPWPIESGKISMHFGIQKVEGLEKITYNNHGITIETDAGKSVKAVFEGEVSLILNIGEVQGIILKHGKYFTTYSNLSSASVSKGQQVKRGQVIGHVADKGDGDGELEFLISNEKSDLNPELWLRK
ncbi:MAG: peptidoglycan DD-metalloendopeptidase family protein [Chitinophagaceae bacterium]